MSVHEVQIVHMYSASAERVGYLFSVDDNSLTY